PPCTRSDLHAFPTRRSSDLVQQDAGLDAGRHFPLRVPGRVNPPLGVRNDIFFPAVRQRKTPLFPARLRLKGSTGIFCHPVRVRLDRKSTRLNSSHVKISYAV